MARIYEYDTYKRYLPELDHSKTERLGITETTPCTWQGADISLSTYYCEKFNMGIGVRGYGNDRPFILLFNHRSAEKATKLATISLNEAIYVYKDAKLLGRDRWKLTREEVNNFAELMEEKCVCIETRYRLSSIYDLLCYMNNSLLMHRLAKRGMACSRNFDHVRLFVDGAEAIQYIIPYGDVKMPPYRRLHAYKKS